jgi:predicted transcriptional regulator
MSYEITKSDLSRKSGLSRACIDRIESGIKPWNVDSEIIYIETLNKTNP